MCVCTCVCVHLYVPALACVCVNGKWKQSHGLQSEQESIHDRNTREEMKGRKDAIILNLPEFKIYTSKEWTYQTWNVAII